MKKLRLYDTASRKVSEFKPIVAGQASIYLCGATVQASPHVGHVRSGINFDILRRWLIASALLGPIFGLLQTICTETFPISYPALVILLKASFNNISPLAP